MSATPTPTISVPVGRRGKFTRGPAKHGSAQALTGFLRFLTTQPEGNAVANGIHFGLLNGRQPLRTGLYFNKPNSDTVDLVGFAHEPGIPGAKFDAAPLDHDTPITFTLKTGISTFESLTDTIANYPETASARPLLERFPNAELACMPLISLGTPVGVLATLFASPPKRTWADREFADGVVCGLALWLAGLGEPRHQPNEPPRPTPASVAATAMVTTARQADILALLRNGVTQTRVAHTLGCSISTVKNDINALATRLGASNTKELLQFATLAGL